MPSVVVHEVAADLPTASSDLFARLAAGDLAARDALLVEHLPLVKHIAGRMSRSLTVRAEFDELVSAGTIGLIQAVDAFDATRGHAFSSFAAPRIRGAILDELRQNDHASRRVRRKERDVRTAKHALEQSLGRPAEDGELAAHLGVAVDTLWRWQHETAGATHTSIDVLADGRRAVEPKTDTSVFVQLVAPEPDSPDAQLDRAETAELLRDAILALKEQERVVLAMYYYEELPMKAIAPVLNVTESRVCQIHKKALHRLRAAVSEQFARAA